MKLTRDLFFRTLAIGALATATAAMTGCPEDTDDGVEDAAETVEDAADDAADAVDDAADDAADAIDDATDG